MNIHWAETDHASIVSMPGGDRACTRRAPPMRRRLGAAGHCWSAWSARSPTHARSPDRTYTPPLSRTRSPTPDEAPPAHDLANGKLLLRAAQGVEQTLHIEGFAHNLHVQMAQHPRTAVGHGRSPRSCIAGQQNIRVAPGIWQVGGNGSQQRLAIHVRQAPVTEDHQSVRVGAEAGQCRGAIGRFVHLISRVFEKAAQELTQVRVIVDDQYVNTGLSATCGAARTCTNA
jgi:hypothetical protein